MVKFYKKILDNGMTIILEKRKLPVVSLAYAIKIGSKHEKINEKGISHFIEHLLYKGTKKRSAIQISKEIEENGGELNGFTSENLVAYWAKMPSKKISIALEVLTDMIKNPLFEEKEIEKERQVIYEEIKMYKDNPRLHVFDKIREQLYKEPFSIGIAGEIETLEKIKKEQIVKFYKKNYTPNNLILAAVGNINFNKLIKFAKKEFNKIKEKQQQPKVSIQTHYKSKIEKRQGIEQANLIFAYRIPKANQKENYAAQILSELTAGGMSSILFEEIREKRNLAYAVRGDSEIDKDFAYNFIYIGCIPKNKEKIKKIILEEFKKISENLKKEKLNKIKEQMIGKSQINQEESQNQLSRLLFYEASTDAKELYSFEKKIREVKLEEIKKIAKEISKKQYAFYGLIPK
jgi:predicted Zn-dependent peptidase